MPHITIEYMIMVPVLIMQIFIFPLTATAIMDTWMDSHRTIELQETAGYLGSSVQQLCYTINKETISDGSIEITIDIPQLIDNRAYTTTMSHVTNLDTSYTIMNITIVPINTIDKVSTMVSLGQNVDWQENLAFNSTQPSLTIMANKTSNSIWLSLGGSS